MTGDNEAASTLIRQLQEASEQADDDLVRRISADLLGLEQIDDDMRMRRAVSLLDTAQFDQALVALDDLAARGLDQRLVLTGRANALFELCRNEEAESALRAALLIAPSSSRWTMLGAVQTRLGEDDKAAECYAAALALEPNNDEALYGLALAVGDQDPQRAIGLLSLATTIDQEHAPHWRELAWFQLRVGDVLRAEDSLSRALSLDSQDPEIRIYLAHCAAERGDWERAHKHLLLAARLAPDSAAPIVIGAALAERFGNLPLATRLSAEAVRHHPTSSDAALLLAQHLLRLGARDQSLKWVMRSLEIDGRNARARRLLERVRASVPPE